MGTYCIWTPALKIIRHYWTILEYSVKKIYEMHGGKTVHVVFKYLPGRLQWKGVGAAGITRPPSPPTLFPSNPWVFHLKDDVTVIPLLCVSFMDTSKDNEDVKVLNLSYCIN
jgi:hypothetical protein